MRWSPEHPSSFFPSAIRILIQPSANLCVLRASALRFLFIFLITPDRMGFPGNGGCIQPRPMPAPDCNAPGL